VAALVGADPHNVIFTASATEAANQALTPHWFSDGIARPVATAYVSAIEHPCVLAGGGFGPEAIVRLPVTPHGTLDIITLEQLLKLHDLTRGRPLLALMLANNETGIVQPLAEAAALVHAAGGYLVCDAVQAAGRLPVDLKGLGADAIFLSAHKLGGPKGVGALVLADEAAAPAALIRGVGQERGHRAGTENVAAIAGFGAAAKAALADLVDMPHTSRLRDRLEAAVTCPAPSSHSPNELRSLSPMALLPARFAVQRLPNTVLLSLPGAKAEILVIQLDLAGIAVSAGSACSSGKVKRSHVLDAMGIDPAIAEGTIRVSLGHTTTEADIDRFVAVWSGIARR
jgi:cysteine desulfurase